MFARKVLHMSNLKCDDKPWQTCVAFRVRPVDRVVRHALDEEVEDGDGVFLSKIRQNVKRIPTFRVRSLGIDLRFR